jgi:hydrogenase maturation protease
MKKILLAGIGNIFQGDDAFGCEIIRALAAETLPAGVTAVDYGIRSYDLAYALNDDYDAVVLIDAAGQGKEPGSVYLMQLDPGKLSEMDQGSVDPHAMNPVSVIQMAQSFGVIKSSLYLIGCEPENLGGEDGAMGLSERVEGALPQALQLTRSLLAELLSGSTAANLNPVTA